MKRLTLAMFLLGLVLGQTGCMAVSDTATDSSNDASDVAASSNDSPPIDNSASDTAAQMQQLNDINALNASMAAAEQQNEAAQQQTLQTEINAMPVDNSNQW